MEEINGHTNVIKWAEDFYKKKYEWEDMKDAKKAAILCRQIRDLCKAKGVPPYWF